MKQHLRIVLADDHEVVRLGLRLALSNTPHVEVVGEARNAEEALQQCQALRPDVIIMDIRMPGKSGIEACREIVLHLPETRVIVLTSYVDDDLIADAIQAGAVGYVLKDVSMTELMRALDAVRQGTASLDPAVTHRVMAMLRQKNAQRNPFKDLTQREMRVLFLVAQGKTNTVIAAELVLSEKTVRNYVSSVITKLGFTNRVEAATFAMQHRIEDFLPETDSLENG